MDERIKEHLKYLNKYYLLLLEAQKISRESFLKDLIHQASTERWLQLAIESCLNIGNRLISLLQFSKPVTTPETYADIFKEMQKLGIIEYAFMQQLINMAKFRNRLVHIYWEVDPENVYQFVQENLDDFKLFEKKVVAYLKQNELET